MERTLESTGNGGDGRSSRGIGEIVQELKDEVGGLFRAEYALIRAEVREKTTAAKQGGAAIAVGSVMLLCALGAFVAFAIAALATVLPTWASALIVTAVLGGGGAVALMVGLKKVKAAATAPERTMQTVQRVRELSPERA